MRNRPVTILITAIIGALTLSACNTIAGVGRDIRSAGDTIEDAAD
jgi:predicted small secreted protein